VSFDDDASGRDDLDWLPPLDAQPGPARRIASARANAIVAKAIDRAEAATRPASRTTMWQAAAIALLALGAASTAVAAVFIGANWVIGDTVWIEARRAPPAIAEERAAGDRARETGATTELALDEPFIVTAEERVARVIRRATRGEARDELARANTLRASRRWRAAEESYGRVAARFRGSEEAYAAAVAAADLRLEHLNDPGGALRMFRAAVRAHPRGALAEEARYGVAECERALHHDDGEASALRSFLSAHPGSALAPRVRARLGALGQGASDDRQP